MRKSHLAPFAIAALATAGLLLSGCATGAPLSQDFGVGLKQDLAAQIVEPEGSRGPPPTADGVRVGLAQSRYQKGEVIQPVATIASKIGAAMGTAATPSAP